MEISKTPSSAKVAHDAASAHIDNLDRVRPLALDMLPLEDKLKWFKANWPLDPWPSNVISEQEDRILAQFRALPRSPEQFGVPDTLDMVQLLRAEIAWADSNGDISQEDAFQLMDKVWKLAQCAWERMQPFVDTSLETSEALLELAAQAIKREMALLPPDASKLQANIHFLPMRRGSWTSAIIPHLAKLGVEL